MNKRTVTFLGGAAVVMLAVSGCGGTTYEYQVSGTVSGQHVDVDCPKSKGTLSMEAVSFDTGKHKTKTKKSKTGKSAKAPKDKPTKSPSPKVSKSTGSKSNPTATATKRPTQKTVRNVGVLLSKKPDKPEKLKGLTVPNEPYTFRKGCKWEYEIFVLSGGHLYEQDVRKVDYQKCQRAQAPKGRVYKLFPLCTKG